MNIALEFDIFTPQNYEIGRESNLTVTEFVPQSPFNDLAFWKFIPSSLDVNKAPIVVVHGVFRGAESQLKAFSDIAQRTGRLLIAPFFCTTCVFWLKLDKVSKRNWT
ncbi:MAG: hypothetical protein KJ798_01825 [Gammaproteobacteria bacterium]|nr:hypothetical protein [Gammaproteobacteria bacterium]MBU0848962.1 hypothetical protein [Gammaproteobacteria bacterium]MBU1268656.1 hypothetical protein [Gammaproteobacteria bacterium]MBU1779098.1 hypothetical protein [Gammaproteobacteria bacterium]